MTDDILTAGLRSDRYLKAIKLVDQFETTLLEILEVTGREMLAESGFDADVTFDEKAIGEGFSATLATIRTECPLLQDGHAETRQLLNVAMEWVDPETLDEARGDGSSFRYVLYKLQHGSTEAYRAVEAATVGDDAWRDVRFGEDQWYSPGKHAPGTVYIPIEDGTEIEDPLRTLKEHFVTVYAPELEV